MGQITIKDVARECGISVTTVSRVLSGSSYPVSAGVRAKVESTAKKLGYSPNILARSLKKSVSNEVAVITPSVVNPFYTAMIKGIEQQLWGSRYGMVIYVTGQRGRSDEDVIQSLRGKMVAGVIAASDSVSDELLEELVKFKRSNSVPIVLTDYQRKNDGDICGVFFDYEKGAALAAEYFLKKGHRRIAFATNHLDRRSRVYRYKGFGDMLRANGVELGEENTFFSSGETSFQSGLELSEVILKSAYHPTAVAAINDTVASGILSGLAAKGIKVPEDISVIGFDDIVFAEMSFPPLTTVNIPVEKMGELAARRLLDELSGNREPYSIFMQPTLVERKTVRALIP